MIYPAPAIRRAFYGLLDNGAVQYNSNPVEVSEGEGEILPYQIIIEELQFLEDDTKHSFSGRVTQPVEVVTRNTGRFRSDIVDEIVNSVLALIIPNPGVSALNVTGFQVGKVNINIIPLKEESASKEKINRRIIEFNFFINQNS